MHSHHNALGLATAPTGNASVAVIANQRPVQPVTLLRPHAARRAARFFVEKFPGRSLYAVKANPSPELLHILWDSGVTHYDVASIAEVRLVRATLPQAVLCFMHPIKASGAIREAYHAHGVKTFSLDSVEELEKIVEACRDPETGAAATDLRRASSEDSMSFRASVRTRSSCWLARFDCRDEPENAYTVDVNGSLPLWDWGERDAEIGAQEVSLRGATALVRDVTNLDAAVVLKRAVRSLQSVAARDEVFLLSAHGRDVPQIIGSVEKLTQAVIKLRKALGDSADALHAEVGRYADAEDINKQAVAADDKLVVGDAEHLRGRL